jgi:hypothetical protein
MKIPLGIISKMCSKKHEVAQGLGKKRRQSSFTVNARKEGGRTLIKIPWLAKKVNSNFKHDQLLSPLLNIFPSPHPPFSRTHSLIHVFASLPRHQPQLF